MYLERVLCMVGGVGIMLVLLLELGDELLFEVIVFFFKVVNDGVFEFNGVWGCVGVLIGVVFFLCGIE